jgi:trans-aconitate 2-methyltransferase
MRESVEVKSWYNDYSEKQVRVGVNLRHYTIMNEVIKAGLKRNSKVLEIGCGVGTLTELLHRYVKRGKIVSTDISDQSIAIARNRFGNSGRNEFITTDMKGFSYRGKFDFIILADVLEHIPYEQHSDLFARIVAHMHKSSLIFINLPHPRALDYIRTHNPALLQIIDQSISADTLMNNIYNNGLIILSYVSCSIFDKETDYAMIWLKKDGPITLRPLPKSTIILRKIRERIKFLLASL